MSTWKRGAGGTVRQTRIATKVHRCDDKCIIRPGDPYQVVTALPGDDSGYASAAGHPLQMKVCAKHAAERGRADEVKPVEGSVRAVVDAQIAKWADDFSFTAPADMAEQLLKALDGGR